MLSIHRSITLPSLLAVLAVSPPAEAQPAPDAPAPEGPEPAAPAPAAPEPAAPAPAAPVPPEPAPEVGAEARPPQQPPAEPAAAQPDPPPSSAPAAKAAEVDVSDVDAAFAEPATPAASSPAAGSGLANPDLSLTVDFAAAYFSDDDPLQTGAHDPEKTGFNLQQLELALGASVDPYFRLDASLVFAPFGVEIEEAYATTLELPLGLQARFGQFLTRFGRLNATHLHAWNFVDQPFSLGRVFGAEGNRGLGVELSWLAPLPWSLEVVASVLDADGEGTMRSFYGARDLGVDGVEDLAYVTAVEQFFPLSNDWSLGLGVSGAFGPNSSGRANRTDVYGADVYLKYRPITRQSATVVALTSEWIYRRREIPDQLLQDASGYAELFWRFFPRFGAAVRYEYGSPSYELDGDVSFADPLDPEWVRSRHRTSASLTFWPSEFSRLRVQVSRDDPGYRDAVWAAFLAAEVVAGAHGAHAF